MAHALLRAVSPLVATSLVQNRPHRNEVSWRYYECHAFRETDSSENSLVNEWGITFKPYDVAKNLEPRSGGGALLPPTSCPMKNPADSYFPLFPNAQHDENP